MHQHYTKITLYNALNLMGKFSHRETKNGIDYIHTRRKKQQNFKIKSAGMHNSVDQERSP